MSEASHPDPVHPDPTIAASLQRLRARQPRGVLFVCVANSARSQIAEGVARALAPDGVRIFSAGSQATQVHSLAVRVLEEIGVDAGAQWSKSVEEIDLDQVDCVITLCREEHCPVLRTDAPRESWPLPDPAMAGRDALDGFRAVRDELQRRISALFRGR